MCVVLDVRSRPMVELVKMSTSLKKLSQQATPQLEILVPLNPLSTLRKDILGISTQI